MSDVIRNAIIKLAIQLDTPNLKIPSFGPATKEQEKLAEAVQRVTVARDAATASAAKASQVDAKLTTASTDQGKALLKLGESSLGTAKGLAFIAAGQSDALSK